MDHFTGGIPIFLFQSSSAAIFNNVVTNPARCGICIAGNSGANIGDNTVFDSGIGIGALESSYIFLPGGVPNTLIDNRIGIHCEADGVIRVDEEQNFETNVQDGFEFNGCTIRNFVGVPFPLPQP